MIHTCLVTVVLICTLSPMLAIPLPHHTGLGHTKKMTVLVDKVMAPEAGGKTQEWMIKEAADAGFNVFSPRKGFDDLIAVKQVSTWCEKYGMKHMPWMRGALTAPEGSEANGKRLVWPDGSEQLLWSPNSDEFWAWTSKYIVEYARQSVTDKSMIGVFLDYENYARGKQDNLYSLSYDNLIMSEFAKAKDIELPALDLSKRKTWLEGNNLSEEFEKFQVNRWREHCRELRRAVDAHNPRFQFCIYPAPGTMFMLQACYPELATDTAPIILADPSSYGRSKIFINHFEGLKLNRSTIDAGLKIAKDINVPFIYLGGVDPAVNGADPEYCGKNALSLTEMADGYWVFYEGPQYKTTHRDYFNWFTWANNAIRANDFNRWQEARETSDPFGLAYFTFVADKLTLPDTFGKLVTYPTTKLRGGHMLLVVGLRGTPVNITLQHFQIGKTKSEIQYSLTDASYQMLQEGTLPSDEPGIISFTPTVDGIYALTVGAGNSAYSLVSADAPTGIYAKKGLRMIYGSPRLYFHVPTGLDKFTLKATGQGVETVKLTVWDSNGRESAKALSTPSNNEIELTVPVATQDGKTWSVGVDKGDEGVLEDSRIILDPKLPPVVSLMAEQVLMVK